MSRILTGIALGAAGAFMLDPQQGRRRRALLRDRMAHTLRESREFSDAARNDLRARAKGAAARVRSLRGGPVGDDVLVARLRAKLGRYVSHPRAVQLAAREGAVTVTGDVLTSEHLSLVRALRSVPGVRDLDDRLDVHSSAERISMLQGGAEPGGEHAGLLHAAWSPGIRALAGGAGALLLGYALLRGGFSGIAAIAAGAALVARAKANKPLGEVVQRSRVKASPVAAEPAYH